MASIVTVPCCGSLHPRPARSYAHTVVSGEAARRTRTHSRTFAPSAGTITTAGEPLAYGQDVQAAFADVDQASGRRVLAAVPCFPDPLVSGADGTRGGNSGYGKRYESRHPS